MKIGQSSNLFLKFKSNFVFGYPNNIDFEPKTWNQFFDLHTVLNDILNNHEKDGLKLYFDSILNLAKEYQNKNTKLFLESFFTVNNEMFKKISFDSQEEKIIFKKNIEKSLNITDKNISVLHQVIITENEYEKAKHYIIDKIENYTITLNEDFFDGHENKNAFCHSHDPHDNQGDYDCIINVNSRKFLENPNFPKLSSIDEIYNLADYVCNEKMIKKYENTSHGN